MLRNSSKPVNYDANALLWRDVERGCVVSQDVDQNFRVLDLDELVQVAEGAAVASSLAPFQAQASLRLPWNEPPPPLLRSLSPAPPGRHSLPRPPTPDPPPPPPLNPPRRAPLGVINTNTVNETILKRELRRVERCAAKQGRRIADQERIIAAQGTTLEKQLKIISGLVSNSNSNKPGRA